MTTLATPENMARVYKPSRTVETDNGTVNIEAPKAIAYSPVTHEEYSGHPGDYWDKPSDKPLVDSEGEPMILVYERTIYVDAITGESV